MSRIETNKHDSLVTTGVLKEDFKERLATLDQYYGDKMEDMAGTIEEVRRMAKEAVAAKEKEL